LKLDNIWNGQLDASTTLAKGSHLIRWQSPARPNWMSGKLSGRLVFSYRVVKYREYYISSRLNSQAPRIMPYEIPEGGHSIVDEMFGNSICKLSSVSEPC
jgi:hypothetical protein